MVELFGKTLCRLRMLKCISIKEKFNQNIPCGSRVMSIFTY